MISAVLLGTGLAAFQVSTAPPPAAVAADGRDFKPGNIISDAVFYNSSAMTAAQVQSFLNARVPSCRTGYTCLKDFRQTTGSQPARSEGCAAYAGRSNETAATIISRVASACGINPQALIVLLEKEQSLITDTWPTDRQYRSATGYGCPDTADCDANYYGFFNQVYHAAWQFKKYQARPLDRGYIAGRNNTILWHPNTGCGSSSVFIENQATAGLYVYTPYRPNAAALNNLYGTGDGCSSYGNRNFWRIFTDWFGPTTGGPAPAIVRADGQSAVYLVNGSTKHHISADDYPALLEAFGPRQIVSKAYVDGLSTGKAASRFLRNTSTGVIAFVAEGQTHRFPNCDLVALWGSSCGDGYLDVGAALFGRTSVGREMTKFAKAADGQAYMLEGQTRYRMVGSAAPTAFNKGVSPYAPVMSAGWLGRFANGRALVGPGTFVKLANESEVYFIDGRSRRYHLPNWAFAAEYGKPKSYTTISASVMSGYTSAGPLSLLAHCGTQDYALASGKLIRIGSDTGGQSISALTAETCAGLTWSSPIVKGPLFYKAAGNPAVYIMRDRKLHHISSPAQLRLQNGTAQATVLTVSPSTLQQFVKSTAALDVGTFAQRTDKSGVYLVNGWQLVHLPTWSVADAYGLPRDRKRVAPEIYSPYKMASKPLSLFATCRGNNYVAYGGILYPVTAAQIGGRPVTPIHLSVCSLLRFSTAPPPAAALLAARPNEEDSKLLPKSSTPPVVVDPPKGAVPDPVAPSDPPASEPPSATAEPTEPTPVPSDPVPTDPGAEIPVETEGPTVPPESTSPGID